MSAKLEGPRHGPVEGKKAEQLVVLLHGYGSDGADLISLAPYFATALPHALFQAPDAPMRCIDNALGFQWFAIDWNARAESRALGLPAARAALVHHLHTLWEETGLGPASTMLVGFSQGAMMALHVGLSLDEPLMGIAAFSGAFVAPEGFGLAPVTTPVCLVHGDLDDVVDPEDSHQAETELARAGVPVRRLVDTGVGHSISPRGLEFALNFMKACMARARSAGS